MKQTTEGFLSVNNFLRDAKEIKVFPHEDVSLSLQILRCLRHQLRAQMVKECSGCPRYLHLKVCTAAWGSEEQER